MSTPPETDGPFVAQFIETFCRHSKGDGAGQPMILRPWQKQILDELFELRPDGRRRYRTALLGMPRKNAKSTLGAALSLYFLVADGEPGGEVYSVAGDRQQARVVFGEAKRMVEADPELSGLIKVYRDVLEVPSTNSVYRVLSADAGLQQGLNPHAVLFDELHVQKTPDLWDAMTLGSGTRSQPLTVAITTAGFDRTSILWRLYSHGKKVQAGEVDDPTFFFKWFEPSDPACDHLDPAVWAECNPALGDFLHLEDFESVAKHTHESAFRRYRLNQWTSTYSAWLKAGVFEALAVEESPCDAFCRVVLGFDGSSSNDSTALVSCCVEHLHLTVVDAWEKPEDDDAWRVDVADVIAALRQALETLNVESIVCDTWGWRSTLQHLHDTENFPIAEVPNSLQRKAAQEKLFRDAVYEGRLSHDGDPRLERHVRNVTVKAVRGTDSFVLTKQTSAQKIDLAVAASLALQRAAHLIEAPPKTYDFISL